MLTKRIIACLDVKEGQVVKGVQFRDHTILGDILELSQSYRDQGVDELVFYDITASAERRLVAVEWIAKTAKRLDIPFCVAGGIRNIKDARAILHAGADKISINSPALEDPTRISEFAKEFGTQCVVVGVDSRYEDGDYYVYKYTGSEKTIQASRRRTLDWVVEAQERGAGELVLNCMNQDGVGQGYDIAQLRRVRAQISIPLVASGGAGKPEHFLEVFEKAEVDAALAAGVFHRKEIQIPDLKTYLQENGVAVRL